MKDFDFLQMLNPINKLSFLYLFELSYKTKGAQIPTHLITKMSNNVNLSKRKAKRSYKSCWRFLIHCGHISYLIVFHDGKHIKFVFLNTLQPLWRIFIYVFRDIPYHLFSYDLTTSVMWPLHVLHYFASYIFTCETNKRILRNSIKTALM